MTQRRKRRGPELKSGPGRVPLLAKLFFAALPLVLLAVWLLPADLQRMAGGEPYEPPEYEMRWTVKPGDPDAPPTIGMVPTERGFRVTRAPTRDVTQGDRDTVSVALEEGNFRRLRRCPVRIRALPREVLVEPFDGEYVRSCTLEGPPGYRGRLVLIDGCLRFMDEGSGRPGPLVLAYGMLFRDKDGYLAFGAPQQADLSIRVGEPGGRFEGVGCSSDRPVPAPPALANRCGVATMRRLGVVARMARCSDERLAELTKMRLEYDGGSARARAQHEACVARTGSERACPPPLVPPHPSLSYPDCRVPPGHPADMSPASS